MWALSRQGTDMSVKNNGEKEQGANPDFDL